MQVSRFTGTHPLWTVYAEHLARHNYKRWVTGADGLPKSDIVCLGVVVGGLVIGDITLHLQPIHAPATPYTGGEEVPVRDAAGRVLQETYVDTFAVDEDYRRQGYGRALQLAALALTQDMGAYQMRSWSSAERWVNYALKISLGFGVHPATLTMKSGRKISGVYFVKRVGGAS